MSLSNTGSDQKASAAISSLEFLQPYAWSGVTLFAAPEWDQVIRETGASRVCGMASAGVGIGSGVSL